MKSFANHMNLICLLTALLLFLFGGVIRVIVNSSEFCAEFNYLPVITAMYIAAIILWIINVRRKFVGSNLITTMTVFGTVMIFWLVIKYIKYELTGEGIINRYLWYMFYIPMIMLPLLMFYACMYLGRMDKSAIPKRIYLMAVPGILVIIAVMTNDLHEQAFKFTSDIGRSVREYEHGPVYFICIILIGIYLISTLILIFTKYIRHRIKLIIIPIAVMSVGIFYAATYRDAYIDKTLLQKMFELPEFISLFFIVFFETTFASIHGVRMQIAFNLDPQLKHLENMLAFPPEDGHEFRRSMKYAAILNVYIKRRSNMLLLAMKTNAISSGELNLSFAESMEYVHMLGVDTYLEFNLKENIRSEVALFLYALYQDSLEAAYDDCADEDKLSVFLSVTNVDDSLRFYMEISGAKQALYANYRQGEISLMGGNLDVKVEDGCEFITYTMPLENALLSGKDLVKMPDNDSFKESVLATKRTIHDDAGKALLALKIYLSSGHEDESITKEKLLDLWNEEVVSFRNAGAIMDRANTMEALINAA